MTQNKNVDNSAHDDIHLQIPFDKVEEHATRLEKKNLINEAKMLRLIHRLEEADKTINQEQRARLAKLQKKKVKFTNTKNSDVTAEFSLENVACDPTRTKPESNKITLLETCLELLKSESIESMAFTANEPMKLDELIREMDLFGIGRPSTFASVLDKLEKLDYEENEKPGNPSAPAGLIEINKFDGSVKLNEAGLKVLLYLKEKYPDLASRHLSSELTALFDDLAEGSISLGDGLKKIANLILDDTQKRQLEPELWHSLNELYPGAKFD